METTNPHSTGEVDFSVPQAGKQCKTWYCIFGDLSHGKRPLVGLHGGPGACHGYMRPLADLVERYKTPVILYDQIGNGNSTHLREKMGDAAFWTESLFISELENLLQHLKVTEFDLLGHSWGGMMGARYATLKPKGLRRLVISNSPASMSDWVEATDSLRRQLPKDVQDVLAKHEKDGTTDSEEYEAAVLEFYKRHLCRVWPFPKGVQDMLDVLKDDMTTYLTMNGPSEFYVTGSLKNWTIVDELHKIVVPTLLINAKNDEAKDSCVMPFFMNIKKVKWCCMETASHLSMWEERDRYNQIVGDFICG